MKVSIIAALTLDGKIAEETGQNSLEWTSQADKRFFVQKTKESGVMVMGRMTFETIGRPLKGRRVIVMTRDPSRYRAVSGELEFTEDAPEEIIEKLAREGYEEVMIAGGAKIYSSFLRAGLVTDLYLTFESMLLGKGISFIDDVPATQWKLVNVERLGENAVVVHYKK